MANDRDALALIEGLERASKRARPFLIVGLLALLIGVALVIYSLEQQRREALDRAEQAEQLVRTLQAAQRSGSPRLVSRALAQAQDLRSSLAAPGEEAPAPAAASPAPPPTRPGRDPRRPGPVPAEPQRGPQVVTPGPDPAPSGPTPADPTPADPTHAEPTPQPAEPGRPATGTGYYVVRQELFNASRSNPRALEALLAQGVFGPFPLTARVNLRRGAGYYVIPLCAGQLQLGRSQLIRGGDRMPPIRC